MTSRIRALRAPDDEDGFALIVALFVILVVAALSLSMAAVILNQAKPTREARKSLTTINAAEAGLQVALLSLRAANDGAGNGVPSKLPCTGPTGAGFSTSSTSTQVSAPGATLSGAVAPAATYGGPSDTGSPTYRVSIAYFRVDPANLSPSALQANAMACAFAGGMSLVPLYAYLQGYGSGTAVKGDTTTSQNRTQVATYRFAASNINVVGGRLRSYGTQQCVDAGPNPAIGSTLTLQPCLALGTASQTWQYRQDLSLFYGGNVALSLCIQAPSSGDKAVLAACTGSGTGTTYPYASGQQAQEWGFNDNGHFAAALNDGTVTNSTGGACLQPRGASGSTAAPSGADLTYASCEASTTGPAAFDPDAQVGAGKAGGGISGVPGATKQYVNYAQFGRCLDITGQNVNSDHLIAYPCKQAPDSTKLTFNQVWTYSAATGSYGKFYVTQNGTNYCLTAPASGNLVTTTPCQTTLTDNQAWVASGNVAGNYPASYTLTSKSLGQCMGVSPLSEAYTFGSSNITVGACDGSSSQKWNAPPVDPTSTLSNIHETNVS